MLPASMPVHTATRDEMVAVQGDTAPALWAEGGEFAAHAAAVKRALGPERVKQLTAARKEEEVVKQLSSLPCALKVERSVLSKDKETALQYKEQGNDLFRYNRLYTL